MPPLPLQVLPVAVVGAGYLGRPIACALPSPVLVTTRNGTWPEGPVPEGIQLRALDVTAARPGEIAGALAGARSLVICYAPGRDQDRRALYVDGTAALLDACAGLSLQRVVYTSSTSALPDAEGWLDDDCPDWPDDPRGRVQREGEATVLAACARRGTPCVIARLGGLYGPGRELFRLYRNDPTRVQPGDGMQATNLIHRDDAVQAVLAALALPGDTSAVVNVVDDDHRPRREMFARLADRAGLPPPRWEHEPESLTPVGKRVRNGRLKSLLRVALRHPLHAP